MFYHPAKQNDFFCSEKRLGLHSVKRPKSYIAAVRIDPKSGKRRQIGATFYCQSCGKTYIECECKVYQSAYAKGRTRW